VAEPVTRHAAGRSHAEICIHAARGWARQSGKEVTHVPLSMSEKAELSRLAQVIDFRTAGTQVFAQGDDAAFVYLLTEGLVRLCHSLRNGERQIVAFHWPGDLFGLAEQGRYVHSAETVAPTRVYRFPVRRLENFLLKNPNVQDGFLVKATHDLRHTQRQLIVMGRFDMPKRLANFLLDCSAHPQYFDQTSHVLTLPMSRYDIADYLGTSAETVTRAFTRLEAEGMLHRVTARAVALKLRPLKAFVDFD
jgi:CRP-like cAMP-binding protein